MTPPLQRFLVAACTAVACCSAAGLSLDALVDVTGGGDVVAAATESPSASANGTTAAAGGLAALDHSVTLTSNSRFINRELSWLRFNERVLSEASNPSHPTFEKVRFLSISANNLDEFYMVRVAGLKGQAQAGISQVSADGLTPAQQLSVINTRASRLIEDQQSVWTALLGEMATAGVAVVQPDQLSDADKLWIEGHFMDTIFPQLTPLSVDPAHPFPFLANKGYGLAMQLLRQQDGRRIEGLLLFPSSILRFIRLPPSAASPGVIRFIMLEHVVLMHIYDLFPAFVVLGKGEGGGEGKRGGSSEVLFFYVKLPG